MTAIKEFAERITRFGFRVYIANPNYGSKNYGFITDDSESRVLSFSFKGGSLSGNYGPPSAESGTGWRMDESPSDLTTADEIRKSLYFKSAIVASRKRLALSVNRQTISSEL